MGGSGRHEGPSSNEYGGEHGVYDQLEQILQTRREGKGFDHLLYDAGSKCGEIQRSIVSLRSVAMTVPRRFSTEQAMVCEGYG